MRRHRWRFARPVSLDGGARPFGRPPPAATDQRACEAGAHQGTTLFTCSARRSDRTSRIPCIVDVGHGTPTAAELARTRPKTFACQPSYQRPGSDRRIRCFRDADCLERQGGAPITPGLCKAREPGRVAVNKLCRRCGWSPSPVGGLHRPHWDELGIIAKSTASN